MAAAAVASILSASAFSSALRTSGARRLVGAAVAEWCGSRGESPARLLRATLVRRGLSGAAVCGTARLRPPAAAAIRSVVMCAHNQTRNRMQSWCELRRVWLTGSILQGHNMYPTFYNMHSRLAGLGALAWERQASRIALKSNVHRSAVRHE